MLHFFPEFSICIILKTGAAINRIIHKRSMVLFALLALLIIAPFVSALSVSNGNAIAHIYPEVGFWGTTIDRTILAKNDGSEAVNVKLETNSSIIEIIDKEFILEAGSEKNARYKINLKKPGEYYAEINVFFSSLDGKGAEAALPSKLNIHAKAKGESSSDSGNTDSGDGGVVDDGGGEVIDTDPGNSEIPAALIVGTSSTLILLALLIVLWVLSKKSGKNTRKSEDFRSLKFSQIRDKTRKEKDRSG